MDISSPFLVNQRLEIAPHDVLEYLSSRIEDYRGNDLVIATPMRKAVPLYLPIGTPILGRAIAGEGILYSFESVLLEIVMQPLPFWIIKKPENVKRIQQRNFFRYPVHLPVCYFIVSEETGRPIVETETDTVSQNLSGGGVLLLSNDVSLRLGTKVWLEIPLSDTDIVQSIAVVVRIDMKKDGEGKSLFAIALQFVNLDEFVRNKIIKFLNARLLEERNKGILM
ncbi:MAG: flagellar brake domain-containing protein [Acidaminococcales bacterium]|jgi:c-di-GMP-binding flagellar brake protein YcgR|nr:flagellar brake domain-containing protein [Acidaminococcales bacterium]